MNAEQVAIILSLVGGGLAVGAGVLSRIADRPRLAWGATALAATLGLGALLLTGAAGWAAPHPSLHAAVLALGCGVALWRLAALPLAWPRDWQASALIAVCLLAYSVAPRSAAVALPGQSSAYGLAHGATILAASALLLAPIAARSEGSEAISYSRRLAGSAFVVGVIGFITYGIGDQYALGDYWDGTPLQAWHLAGWCALTLGAWATREIVSPARRRVVTLLATFILLITLLGAPSITTWLGLPPFTAAR
jgi:hypothetical protein